MEEQQPTTEPTIDQRIGDMEDVVKGLADRHFDKQALDLPPGFKPPESPPVDAVPSESGPDDQPE